MSQLSTSTRKEKTVTSTNFSAAEQTSSTTEENEVKLKQETNKDTKMTAVKQQQGDSDEDWVEIEDKNSGRTYYWNRSTNLTQWNKPNVYTDVNGVEVRASS